MAATVTALQEEFAFSRLVGGASAVLADKDVAGMLELLEPVVDAVVVTRNSSPRAMPARGAGRSWPREVFGDGPGDGRPRTMPDAIEVAVALAEADVAG